MAKPKPLQPPDLIPHVSGVLFRRGFREIYRSRSRNGSRYFTRRPFSPFVLRVADHHWPRHIFDRHPEVVCSICLEPTFPKDVDMLVDQIVVLYVQAVALRRGLPVLTAPAT